jgi:hypothetical protein
MMRRRRRLQLLSCRLRLRGRRLGSAHGSHRFAALCTLAAGAHAIIHIANLFTAICTGGADVSARGTDYRVQRRLAQHEVRRGLANFRAIGHQAKMLGLDVFAALIEAMRHRHLQTNLVAALTR